MIELVDTHCHLNFPVLASRSESLLDQAAKRGVCQVVVPGVVAADWSGLQAFCAEDFRLFPAFGLHPCFVAEHSQEALDLLPAFLKRSETVAVGEIGLDFFIPDADPEYQTWLLVEQLKLAKQFDLPVLLHVRKAHDQMLAQLRRMRLPRGGIVHAFSGSQQQAEQYLALGFRLGFGGAISYARATKLRKLVSVLPLESLVLETDGPDMPLSNFRDQPNVPERVRDIAELIAELRGVAVEEVAAVTTATARKLLFGVT